MPTRDNHRYTITSTTPMFELTSIILRLLNKSIIPMFNNTSTETRYINKSEVLSFKTRTHDRTVPIFAIVLEFYDTFVGIY